ncbi:MAG: hypothetical protein EBQ92_10280, partial [Proteobacteria bacterium]|nr:hypothetical protein [Pseudomonadota bacterium]
MINNSFNRRIGQIIHDNTLSQDLYKDRVLDPVSVPSRERNLSIMERTQLLKKLNGGSAVSGAYKKQVPVIGGNGEPNVEMEDKVSGAEMYKRRLLGAGKSNTSFGKTLTVLDGKIQAQNHENGLRPAKVAQVLEGSVPLASRQLTAAKLKGGQKCGGSLATEQLTKLRKGDLPIPTAESVKQSVKALQGGAKKVSPWNQLIKKVSSEKKCNLKDAIAYIKANN